MNLPRPIPDRVSAQTIALVIVAFGVVLFLLFLQIMGG